MALVNLSPGNFSGCPILRPVKTLTVDSVNFCKPVTEMPPRMYSLPFWKTMFFCTVIESFLAVAEELLLSCALVGIANKVRIIVIIKALKIILF